MSSIDTLVFDCDSLDIVPMDPTGPVEYGLPEYADSFFRKDDGRLFFEANRRNAKRVNPGMNCYYCQNNPAKAYRKKLQPVSIVGGFNNQRENQRYANCQPNRCSQRLCKRRLQEYATDYFARMPVRFLASH